MATTDAEHLVLINQVLTKRANSDGMNSYSVAQRQFVGESTMNLYKLRAELQRNISASSSYPFGLIEPHDA